MNGPRRRGHRIPTMRVVVALLTTAGLVAGTSASAATKAPPARPSAATTRGLSGAYVGPCATSAWQSWEHFVGGSPAVISEFLDLRSWDTISDPSFFTTCWGPLLGPNTHLSLAVPMLPSTGGVSLAQGAAGAYDSYFQTLATNLVAQGAGASYLRVGWEFNGDWQPWRAAADPASWLAYYKRIVTVMRSVPGQQFKFVWSVNYGNTESDGTRLFPGKAYVDYVGLSAYDQGYRPGYSYPLPAHASAARVAALRANAWADIAKGYRGLDFWANFARQRHVAVAVAEWGLARNTGSGSNIHGGGDDAAFVTNFHAWMLKNKVAWAAYWQAPLGWDGQLGTRANGRNYLPKSSKAFQTQFRVRR